MSATVVKPSTIVYALTRKTGPFDSEIVRYDNGNAVYSTTEAQAELWAGIRGEGYGVVRITRRDLDKRSETYTATYRVMESDSRKSGDIAFGAERTMSVDLSAARVSLPDLTDEERAERIIAAVLWGRPEAACLVAVYSLA